MKILWLFILLIGWSTAAGAQDSWKVVHNKKQKLQATGEDKVQNTIILSQADLAKKGSLCVQYREQKPRGDWKRTLALFDQKDTRLVQQEGTVLEVPNAELRALADSVPVVEVYTWALPADPNLAATVRVRRVHLCTLQLKVKP